MREMRALRPEGQAVIVSPARTVPDRIWPAYPRNSCVGRRTSWTGKSERLIPRRPVDVHGLQKLQQRRAREPGRVLARRRHVVAEQRAHGNGVQPDVAQQLRELGADVVEDVAVELDQVHLVDGEHEGRDPQQLGDPGVPVRLRAEAVPRVHEQDRDIGGRGAGRHVARVLLVARACRRG